MLPKIVKYIRADSHHVIRAQLVSGIDRSGSDKKMKSTFVLLRANENGGEKVLVGKVLFFRVEAKHKCTETEEEHAPLKWMKCTEPLDEIGQVSRCVYLR